MVPGTPGNLGAIYLKWIPDSLSARNPPKLNCVSEFIAHPTVFRTPSRGFGEFGAHFWCFRTGRDIPDWIFLFHGKILFLRKMRADFRPSMKKHTTTDRKIYFRKIHCFSMLFSSEQPHPKFSLQRKLHNSRSCTH